VRQINGWIGFGASNSKVNNKTTGMIINLQNPNLRYGFGIDSEENASVNLEESIAVVLVNCLSPMLLNGTSLRGGNFSLNLGGICNPVVKGLQNRRFFSTLTKISLSDYHQVNNNDIASLQLGYGYLKDMIGLRSEVKPKILLIKIPKLFDEAPSLIPVEFDGKITVSEV
jgi:hypothetical protein